jgi:hypothetical protein
MIAAATAAALVQLLHVPNDFIEVVVLPIALFTSIGPVS